MFNQGDKIGEAECAGCGAIKSLKIGKNGGVFIYCTDIIDPEKRERCGTRLFLGRTKSNQLKEEFLQHAEKFMDRPHETEPKNIAAEVADEVIGEQEPIHTAETDNEPEPENTDWKDKPIGDIARGIFSR